MKSVKVPHYSVKTQQEGLMEGDSAEMGSLEAKERFPETQ